MLDDTESELASATALVAERIAMGDSEIEALRRLLQTVLTTPEFLFLAEPNGYNQVAFLPQREGNSWELSPALKPLEPVRGHVSLLSGLDREVVPGTGVHAQCGSCWLTSSAPQETLDGGFPTNTMLDQLLARQLGRDTPLRSLELSCNDFTNRKETKYFECISWYGPGHAAQTEKNPRTAFMC